jgi:hypothetical protein
MPIAYLQEVKYFQQQIGMESEDIDGFFGPITRSAVNKLKQNIV